MVEYQVLREILGPDTDGGYCFTPEVCISPDKMSALVNLFFTRESTNPSSMKSPY